MNWYVVDVPLVISLSIIVNCNVSTLHQQHAFTLYVLDEITD